MFAPGDLGCPCSTCPSAGSGYSSATTCASSRRRASSGLRGADLVAVPTAWVAGFDLSRPSDGVIEQVRARRVQANLADIRRRRLAELAPTRISPISARAASSIPTGGSSTGPPEDDEKIEVVEVDLARGGPGQAPRAGSRRRGSSHRRLRRAARLRPGPVFQPAAEASVSAITPGPALLRHASTGTAGSTSPTEVTSGPPTDRAAADPSATASSTVRGSTASPTRYSSETRPSSCS